MKNHQTHITRFLIIVLMVLIGCNIGLTAVGPPSPVQPIMPPHRSRPCVARRPSNISNKQDSTFRFRPR